MNHRLNSSERTGPSTAEIAAVQLLFKHPGWVHFQHYLKAKRRVAVRQCLTLNAIANAVEISKMQERVRLIDELLADTAKGAELLASSVADNLGL